MSSGIQHAIRACGQGMAGGAVLAATPGTSLHASRQVSHPEGVELSAEILSGSIDIIIVPL